MIGIILIILLILAILGGPYYWPARSGSGYWGAPTALLPALLLIILILVLLQAFHVW
jgi:hypothetical protein